MGKRRYQASITIFLSMLTALFLLFACTVLEGIRIQGAKVRAAACLDMGLFSLFGEYEKTLLADYHVFFLDGSYGSGIAQPDKITQRLSFFMEYNAEAAGEASGTDWFRVKLIEAEAEEVMTATDEGGRPFFIQACLFMRGIPQTNKKQIGALEAQKAQNSLQLFRQIKKELLSSGIEIPKSQNGAVNIKAWLEDRQKEDVLEEMVSSGFPISSKDMSRSEKVSERSLIKGKMKIPENSAGEDGLFKEYLFFTFGNAVRKKERDGLEYEQEYLLKGNKSDQENLREVCKDLLEIRWTCNFLSAAKEEEKKRQAESELYICKRDAAQQESQKETAPDDEREKERQISLFLLAWAYEESVLDVKKLLLGFSVPMGKAADEWETGPRFWTERNYPALHTEKITDIWDYEGYIRLLFEMEQISELPLKALDLIEWEIKSSDETSEFRADCCIAGMTAQTKWQIEPMFFRAFGAFSGMRQKEMIYTVRGSFAYEMEE